jgi:hypothetical protein
VFCTLMILLPPGLKTLAASEKAALRKLI